MSIYCGHDCIREVIFVFDGGLGLMWIIELNNNNKLQFGCHPVVGFILNIYKIWRYLLINLRQEGYMRSMKWQLGIWVQPKRLLIDKE